MGIRVFGSDKLFLGLGSRSPKYWNSTRYLKILGLSSGWFFSCICWFCNSNNYEYRRDFWVCRGSESVGYLGPKILELPENPRNYSKPKNTKKIQINTQKCSNTRKDPHFYLKSHLRNKKTSKVESKHTTYTLRNLKFYLKPMTWKNIF